MDYDDTLELKDISMEHIKLSREYMDSRKRYGSAKKYIDTQLARAYGNGEIDLKHSFDKALLLLILTNEKLASAYNAMIEEEQHYKGLEKVLDAMSVHITLNQSIMKYTQNQVGG